MELIEESFIQIRLQQLGEILREIYPSEPPVMLVILKGAFVFAADLIRETGLASPIEFLQISSYNDTESTGKITTHIPMPPHLDGKHILIIEDIVETGHTLRHIVDALREIDCKSIRLVTCLYKPLENVGLPEIEIINGFVIPPAFVVGYGLDFNQTGRELKSIEVLQ
jgi:hypoxanthine phosphoribosyltransferase